MSALYAPGYFARRAPLWAELSRLSSYERPPDPAIKPEAEDLPRLTLAEAEKLIGAFRAAYSFTAELPDIDQKTFYRMAETLKAGAKETLTTPDAQQPTPQGETTAEEGGANG